MRGSFLLLLKAWAAAAVALVTAVVAVVTAAEVVVGRACRKRRDGASADVKSTDSMSKPEVVEGMKEGIPQPALTRKPQDSPVLRVTVMLSLVFHLP